MTILSVAYPFAPVSLDTPGGSEQIVAILDREFTRSGHQSIVVAQEGSSVEGTLIAVPKLTGPIDDPSRTEAHRTHRQAISRVLREFPVDVVHMHGLDFAAYLPAEDIPTLVTLHLPAEFYESNISSPGRNNIWFNCVSFTQYHSYSPSRSMFAPVRNGIALDLFASRNMRKRTYLLMLTRICPEKGVHMAIEAAKRAGMPLVIAGEIYPYPAHQRYFEAEVMPHLDQQISFVGPANLNAKVELLRGARCVLLPSLVEETSSLTAMEAAACGIPVIAFKAGALPEIVEDGKSGYLVNGTVHMAEQAACWDRIDAEACIRVARSRFDARAMTAGYEVLYRQMTNNITP